MKTLCVLLTFLFSGCSILLAQVQNKDASISEADRAIVQSWQDHANTSDEATIDHDVLVLPTDPDNSTCAFLRVYRMKREVPKSDITRPAGYTTCVGTS